MHGYSIKMIYIISYLPLSWICNTCSRWIQWTSLNTEFVFGLSSGGSKQIYTDTLYSLKPKQGPLLEGFLDFCLYCGFNVATDKIIWNSPHRTCNLCLCRPTQISLPSYPSYLHHLKQQFIINWSSCNTRDQNLLVDGGIFHGLIKNFNSCISISASNQVFFFFGWEGCKWAYW